MQQYFGGLTKLHIFLNMLQNSILKEKKVRFDCFEYKMHTLTRLLPKAGDSMKLNLGLIGIVQYA